MKARTVAAALVAVAALGGAGALVTAGRATGPEAGGRLADVDGAALFQLKGCAQCHDGPRSTSSADVGPPLVDAASWAGSRRDEMSAEAYLRESILAPGAFAAAAPGSFGMPTLALRPDEVDRLVAYLMDG